MTQKERPEIIVKRRNRTSPATLIVDRFDLTRRPTDVGSDLLTADKDIHWEEPGPVADDRDFPADGPRGIGTPD